MALSWVMWRVPRPCHLCTCQFVQCKLFHVTMGCYKWLRCCNPHTWCDGSCHIACLWVGWLLVATNNSKYKCTFQVRRVFYGRKLAKAPFFLYCCKTIQLHLNFRLLVWICSGPETFGVDLKLVIRLYMHASRFFVTRHTSHTEVKGTSDWHWTLKTQSGQLSYHHRFKLIGAEPL